MVERSRRDNAEPMPKVVTTSSAKVRVPPDANDLPLEVVNRPAEIAIVSGSGSLWRKLLAGGLLLVLAGLAWTFRIELIERLRGGRETAPISVTGGSPQPPRVYALGRLEPSGETISVAAPSGTNDARIQSLKVAEGDHVAANDLLAVLDNERQLLAAQQVREHQLAQQRSKLVQTRTVVETTRASLEASLRSSESAAVSAKLKYERRRRLNQTSAVTQEEVDDARLTWQQAAEKVLELKANLQRYAVPANGEPVDLAVARRDVEVAEASLAAAVADLEHAYVRAPKEGVVLEIHLRPGERIGQSSLLDMGATEKMMARVEVYESDIGRIQPGQAVVLSGAALDATLNGEVERIAAFVKRQTVVDADPAAYTDARVIEVMVRLDGPSSELARRFVDLQVRAEFVP
ncbi:MAG: HlyD family efflux transporter periplasmic adaptor subunit [Pirellulales bacterium]